MNINRYLSSGLLGLLSLSWAFSSASAQNSTSSPYSMYGIGILTPKEDAAAAGLGHASVALAPNEWVNISNPAGINNLDSLTFYFNFQLKAFYAKEQTDYNAQSVYSANIDGISMGFRAKKWLAIAFGYSPYSTIGYDMSEQKFIIGEAVKYNINYKGSGGMQQAYFNAAFTLFDHLTLGGNFSALWGSAKRVETSYFYDAVGGENIYNNKKYTMNGIYWELGLQYDFNLGRNNFRLGATYNKKTHLISTYEQTVSNDVSSSLMYDDVTPLKEEFYVPEQFAAGLAYSRGRWLGTFDYRLARWSQIGVYQYGLNVSYRDSYTLAGGIQYSAGSEDDPFFKRLRYRAGGFYTQSYLNMYSSSLTEHGFTLGLSVPVGRSGNAFTVSFERLNRGTLTGGLVKEKFNNFKIAFNVRETWFLKSKFE